MQRPTEWTNGQLVLAVYAYRFGAQDLGYSLDEALKLAGLSRGQWETRVGLDFLSIEGKLPKMPPSEVLRERYLPLRELPQLALREMVSTYLHNRKRIKGR